MTSSEKYGIIEVISKNDYGMMMEEIDLIDLDRIEEYLMDIEKLTKDLAKNIEEIQKIERFQMYRLNLEWIRRRIRLSERGIC